MNIRFTNNTSDAYSGNIYAFVVDPTTTPTDSPIQPTYSMALGVTSIVTPIQADCPWQVVEGGQVHVFMAIDDGSGGYAVVTDIAIAGGGDLHRVRLQGASGSYHFQYIT